MLISIVVPVFNEEKNILQFLTKVQSVMKSIECNYELIFALDPSTDRTENQILSEIEKNKQIKLIKFSRRFGQPMATLGGMAHTSGDAVIVMDVDLQDPPELIPNMINKWIEGYEVVIPQRTSRKGEPLIKKIISSVGYNIIAKVSRVNIPPNTGDFRLMSRRVVQHVLSLTEGHGFLRGLVAIVGFKQCLIEFERPARYAGKTNYNRFIGSLRIGLNGIFGFSTMALQLSTQLGFCIAAGSFLIGIIYLVMKLTGTNFPIGNPTMVILVLFLGGIQLISVGILGEYIGRIYEEVLKRPKYIVDKSIGFTENKSK